MTDTTTESFFDDAVRSGAPSGKFSAVGDVISGEIVEQYTVDAIKFGTDEVEKDKQGNPIKQLVIVLQTNLRNWEKVARIPKVDPTDRNSADKPASEDDGKRAIYVKKYTNLHAAIGKAVASATGKAGPVRNGGKLAVKFFDTEDRGKGNPLKKYQARYEAPADGDFFSAPSEPAPQQSAPPAQDPWSGQPVGGGNSVEEPPF